MLINKYSHNKIILVISFSLSTIAFADIEFTKEDLGTFKADNSGYSYASEASADGRVVVGYAETDSGNIQVFRHNEGDAKMTGLGSLRTDNSGYSYALEVSADGRVVAGEAETDSGDVQAFRHNEGDAKMTGLGSLRTDNSGYSYALEVSADGRVVVGEAVTDSGKTQAFRHNEGDAKMTGLGTLRADNLGNSYALEVSADGRVVVGQAETDSGNIQVFRHNEGDAKMTGLGTLKADNSGNSYAYAVSADGRVVVGEAVTDSGKTQAFRHNEGDAKMTGLGTLRADNLGNSYALEVSADGRVVVGQAETDSGDTQAFRHNEGDAKMTGLGTLKADNSGHSAANAVSADGRVVVGQAETDSGDTQAFRHNEGDAKMTGLGTLKADNSGYSTARAVSADGRVVVGQAETNSGDLHATVWRMLTDDNSIDDNIIIVDATNSNKTMYDAARKTYQVLDLYRSRLMSLSDVECSLDNYNYCVGVFTNYDSVKSNYTFATGLFGALRINPQWSVGLSIDYLVDTSLPNGFKTRGSSTPGIGGFINFQQNSDLTGFNMKLSGAFQEDKISIHRQQLSNTEAGNGDSKIKSHLLKLGVSYGIEASDKSMLFPHVGIVHTAVSRDAYTETRDAYFPATFGKASDERTALEIGLKAHYDLSNTITISGDAGAYVNLNHKRDNFTGRIDYIGSHVYDIGDEKKVQPYISLGIKGTISDNSVINLKTRWSKQGYDNDSFNVGLSYSYRF